MDDNVINFPGAAIIEGSDEMRARKCLKIIQNTLAMYRCLMVPQIVITGTQIDPNIKVIAIPDQVPGEEPPKAGQ